MKKYKKLLISLMMVSIGIQSFSQTTPPASKTSTVNKKTSTQQSKPASKPAATPPVRKKYISDGIMEFYLQPCSNNKGVKMVFSNVGDKVLPEFQIICRDCKNTNKNCKEIYLEGKNLLSRNDTLQADRTDTTLVSPQIGECIVAIPGKQDYSFNFSLKYKTPAGDWKELGTSYSSKEN